MIETDRPAVVYFCFVIFLWTGLTSAPFSSAGLVELLKLWKMKWQKREILSLIKFTGISFSWQAFFLSKFLMKLEISGVANKKKANGACLSFLRYLRGFDAFPLDQGCYGLSHENFLLWTLRFLTISPKRVLNALASCLPSKIIYSFAIKDTDSFC